MSTPTQTPLQREAVETIFEKGRAGPARVRVPAGRRARAPAGRAAAAAPPAPRGAGVLPEVSEPEIVRHYVRLSKRNFDLDSGFYPLGSCTMKHNPRLHERVTALPGHARLHPLQAPERAQGALELMWNLERALAEVSGLPHVSLQPSAGSHGELAGVLLTRAYHEDRGQTRMKVLTPDTAHGTNPATVTMAGLRGREGRDRRARRRRRRRPAREGGRGRRLPHAHEPEHARALRPQHRGDRPDRARRRGGPLLRRGEPQRGHGPHAAGRHGLRHRPLQPAQDVHAAARRRRPRLRADRGVRPHRAVPHDAADRAGRGRLRPRPRQAEVDRAPARLPGQLRDVRALLRLHLLARRGGAEGRVGGRGAQRELPARQAARGGRRRPAAARVRPAVRARVRALRRADEAGARDPHAGPREAAARPRLPPADGVLPAARRRGAARRADGDGDEGDARRVRGRWSRRSCARRARTRRSRATPRTRRRCAASTRPAPRSAR